MSKLYLSGPMRGKDNLNFEAFDNAAALLRRKGFTVFSPAEADRTAGYNGANGERGWKECIIQDAKEVCEADGIVLLPGWEDSRGVFAELAILAGQFPKDATLPVWQIDRAGNLEAIDKPFERIAFVKDLQATAASSGQHFKQAMQTAKKDGPRVFESGATRNADTGKPDFEGFLSPYVLDAFGEYMHKHRHLEDGSLRDSDNWQKGIPLTAYIKSGWRHFVHWWMLHRGYPAKDEKGQRVTMKDTLAALMFNVMGYFHEWLKKQEEMQQISSQPPAIVRGPGKPS